MSSIFGLTVRIYFFILEIYIHVFFRTRGKVVVSASPHILPRHEAGRSVLKTAEDRLHEDPPRFFEDGTAGEATKTTAKNKKSGCRCGNATACPGTAQND